MLGYGCRRTLAHAHNASPHQLLQLIGNLLVLEVMLRLLGIFLQVLQHLPHDRVGQNVLHLRVLHGLGSPLLQLLLAGIPTCKLQQAVQAQSVVLTSHRRRVNGHTGSHYCSSSCSSVASQSASCSRTTREGHSSYQIARYASGDALPCASHDRVRLTLMRRRRTSLLVILALPIAGHTV